jgi:membrane-bound serine protease (ClpP class)
MEPITLYLTLLLAGFVLIGMEIFIPGGILGIFGSVVWISAAVVGWRNFPDPWNMISAFSLLAFGILTFIVWIRYFPKSRVGRSLSLGENQTEYKSHRVAEVAVGDLGKADSTLRPSGIAMINGKRVDVVADGEWIEAGQAVKVSSVSGGHVSVVKA